MDGRGIKQDLIPYVGQLELACVPIEDGLLTLMYMASLMAILKSCISLPIVEKLSMLM